MVILSQDYLPEKSRHGLRFVNILADLSNEVQCVMIENRQSPFYVVNRVTLTGKNYIKYLASPLNRQYVC